MRRREFLGLAAGAGAASLIGWPVLVEPNWPEAVTVRVPIKGLDSALEGLRVGTMSDFHRSRLVDSHEVDRAVRLMNESRPDLVCLLGDYVDSDPGLAPDCARSLAALSAPLGVFAVLGNHDHRVGVKSVIQALEREGIQVLTNETARLSWRGGSLGLVGLDDAWAGRANILRAMRGVDQIGLNLLMVHEPDMADAIKVRLPEDKAFIPLQLSGHSHGGQLPLWLARPVLPFLGRRYPRGLMRVTSSDRWVYTTRGIGVTRLPVRLGCRPEVTTLVLCRAASGRGEDQA